MTRRSSSTDPRAQRLRARIKQAALELVSQRPVDSISLNELLAAAQVSRQGFYDHFASRDDAILHAINDESAEALDEEALDGLDMASLVAVLAGVINARREVYANVRGSAVFIALVDQWREILTPRVADLVVARRGPGAEAEATTAFVVGGVIELSRAWLRSDHLTGPDVLASMIARQLSAVLGD